MPGIDYTNAPVPKPVTPTTVPTPRAIDYSAAPIRPIPQVNLGASKLPPVNKPVIDYSSAPISTGLNKINAGMDYVKTKAKQFGSWATTSQMPDAEEGLSDYAGKLFGDNIVGDAAKGVTKIAVGGATSPVGLATLGVGALGLKAWRNAANTSKAFEGPLTAEQALVAEIQGARPVIKQTEKLRSIELGKRSAKLDSAFTSLKGEGGAHIAMGELKGELPKVDFESIRPKFTQDNIDTFYDKITKSKLLSPLDKATAKEGLDKVFGEGGGQVPQTSEINLLTKEFGPDFAKALEKHMGMKHQVLDALSVPRTLMASGDVSIPFRQNISNVSRADFWKNIPQMFKAMPEGGYNDLIKIVKSDPHYELANRAGLALTELGQEENFASKLAHYVPWVDPSERAFNGYANKMRMDLFSDLVDKAKKVNNVDAYVDTKYARELAKFVNISTGRGTLGKLENSAKILNTAFFSPRLASSRIQMFTKIFDPKIPSAIRKEYLRNALGYMGFQGSVLTAAALGGAEIVTDITNPDFGKAKFGNTRLDFSGGVAPYVRLLGQLAYNQKTSSVSGKTTELGKGYKADTRNDVVGSFITQKAAPIPATVLDFGRGKDAVGQPISLSSEMVKLMTPIVAQDMYDILKDDPNNLPFIIPALFGVGVQTYGPNSIAKAPSKKYHVSLSAK